jgi:hypothetical protein
MKRLLLLYVMLSLPCAVLAQVEPFSQSYVVFDKDVNSIVVPEKKEFVLLKLYVDCVDGLWQININNEAWLIGKHRASNNYVNSSREFPEGFAVVGSSKNIVLKESPDKQYTYYTLIGYFRDVEKIKSADLNGDRKVNLLDLAILCSQWLK